MPSLPNYSRMRIPVRRSCDFLVVLAALAVCGCQSRPADTGESDYVDEEYQAQVDAFNRQTEQADKILNQQEAELERAIKQGDRTEAILTKHEEQLKRWDAVLD